MSQNQSMHQSTSLNMFSAIQPIKYNNDCPVPWSDSLLLSDYLVSSAKYLGVTIDSKLNFNEHINNSTHKANSTRAFVARNTQKCPTHIKSIGYKSLVRPQLEYASNMPGHLILDVT